MRTRKRSTTMLTVTTLMDGASEFLADAATIARESGDTATVERIKLAAGAINQAKADTLAAYSGEGQP
jgi:hypothetical protein